uniref:RRM domain-containing protein n=1 Tax=Salvator merianae TaxID=96440 RepID=A0A8D0BEV4_SALMN
MERQPQFQKQSKVSFLFLIVIRRIPLLTEDFLKQQSSMPIFVFHIPWTVAKDGVREYFGQFDIVRRCSLPFDRETGFHKGLCWVEFSSAEAVSNALQNGTHITEGVKLLVQINEHPNRRIADNS